VPNGQAKQAQTKSAWRTLFELRKAAEEYRERAARTNGEEGKVVLRALAKSFDEQAKQLEEQMAATARALRQRHL
jgi:hypothetical protein